MGRDQGRHEKKRSTQRPSPEQDISPQMIQNVTRARLHDATVPSGKADNITESPVEPGPFDSRIAGATLAEQIPNHRASMAADNTPRTGLIPFLRQFKRRVLFLSVDLIIPCVWHRRIEAGDLATHDYNAWLAPLIRNGP